jgi:hypothetical protein
VNRKLTLWLLGLLAAASACSGAQAAIVSTGEGATTSVLVNQSELIEGGLASVTPLNAPGAGVLSVTLTDMKFPTSFSSLQFALTDASAALVGLTDAGTISLDLTAPTTVYADVFATTQGGTGLYNLKATFVGSSPVPLPASAASLAAGLLVLLFGLYHAAQSRSLMPAQATVTTPMA